MSHGRSLRLPRVSAGYIRLTCGVPHSTCVMGPLLLPTRMEVLALSLTAQARSVRVPVPRGTMHASGDSPHHLSAKNLRVGYLPSPHGPFQAHAAHLARWPAMLSSNGSSSTCMPEVFRHSYIVLHGAPRSLGTCVPIFPKARGLRHGEYAPCGRRYRPPTTMPHPTLRAGLGVSLGAPLPTSHSP